MLLSSKYVHFFRDRIKITTQGYFSGEIAGVTQQEGQHTHRAFVVKFICNDQWIKQFVFIDSGVEHHGRARGRGWHPGGWNHLQAKACHLLRWDYYFFFTFVI